MIEASPNPKSRKQTRTAPTGSDTGELMPLNARGSPVDNQSLQRNNLKLFTRLPLGGSNAKAMPLLQKLSNPILLVVLVHPRLAPPGPSVVPPFSFHLMREIPRQIIYPLSFHITVNTCLHEPAPPRPLLLTNRQPNSSHLRAR